ncbi:DUF1934 domain-containing protein [Streptococcus cuniculipharyngis]|uniref:DUF1934 domain-containing protein n=1 Tax=Streptococcus cuniculipharyngis TaxID=1562651 RepID=A0A5C5SE16_9STRE|nr:DUF1934 domain-containing protein [Streptococcus cuniculipharyngis]TWS99054.1 DUF1934 domain-containing protein [Streptococcus cuniculipharyngis]
MKVEIRNKILVDGQAELFHEVHAAQMRDKGDYTYLIYHNEEQEKVVLKFNAQELTMTRFASPQTVMRFQVDDLALARIPSPLGNQGLVTRTKQFVLGQNDLFLAYDLLPFAEAKEVFASYELTIKWFEK